MYLLKSFSQLSPFRLSRNQPRRSRYFFNPKRFSFICHLYVVTSGKMSYVTVITGKQGFQQKLQEMARQMTVRTRHSELPSSAVRVLRAGLSIQFDNSDNSGWKELEQLLTTNAFGAMIWHASFVLGGADPSWRRCFYDYFQRCLSKLPNVKSLTFGDLQGALTYLFEEAEVAKLKAQHENIDIFLPELPRLESLEFTHFSEVRGAVGDKNGPVCTTFKDFFQAILLTYSPQLQKLTMPSEFWREEYAASLQNLTELNLDLEPPSPSELDAIFKSLQENCPKLEKVGMRILVGSISMKTILGAIQLCPQVTALTILASGVSDLVSGPDPSTLLSILFPEPILHTDVHTCDVNRSPLILRIWKIFPGLNYVQIENVGSQQEEEDAWSELGHHRPNFQIGTGPRGERVTIWTFFPKMTTFVLNGNTYEREMYNKRD